jgi:hypothetical protein
MDNKITSVLTRKKRRRTKQEMEDLTIREKGKSSPDSSNSEIIHKKERKRKKNETILCRSIRKSRSMRIMCSS